jgi:hypothetical protein
MTQSADKTAKKPATNEWWDTFVVVVEALLIAIVLRFLHSDRFDAADADDRRLFRRQ